MPSTLRIGVRDLCEFTARDGDLDVRFGISPNARQGVAGHETVTARRGTNYQREVTLNGTCNELSVMGRADGYDAARNRLEEIKTFRGDLSRQPASLRLLHWAQLKVYDWLLCDRVALPSITLALVYFNIDSEQEIAFDQMMGASELHAHFDELCSRYAQWAAQEEAHRLRRDAHIMRLTFPHEAFRPGQRDLAEAVFRAGRSGTCLVAEAPTGIGKSIATLFPMLKAMPVRRLDKIYFLSAKRSGRKLALDALAMCQAIPRIDPTPLTKSDEHNPRFGSSNSLQKQRRVCILVRRARGQRARSHWASSTVYLRHVLNWLQATRAAQVPSPWPRAITVFVPTTSHKTSFDGLTWWSPTTTTTLTVAPRFTGR